MPQNKLTHEVGNSLGHVFLFLSSVPLLSSVSLPPVYAPPLLLLSSLSPPSVVFAQLPFSLVLPPLFSLASPPLSHFPLQPKIERD